MITTKLKQYCRDNFEKIENYDLAINDKENVWEIHHKLELTLDGNLAHSKSDLIRLNMYYNRPYYELILLTQADHARLHGKVNVKNLNNSNIDKSGSNNSHYQKCNSTFGKKYLEHFGYSKCDNIEQYYKERNYYNFHKKCSWE